MRQAKKENTQTKLVRDVFYINGEIYTPLPEPTPQPRGVWGHNPTGNPTVERQSKKNTIIPMRFCLQSPVTPNVYRFL